MLHTANLVGEEHFENNVMCTFSVAKACAEKADDLTRLVSISSSGVYPNDSHAIACAYHPVDENHPRRPTDPLLAVEACRRGHRLILRAGERSARGDGAPLRHRQR